MRVVLGILFGTVAGLLTLFTAFGVIGISPDVLPYLALYTALFSPWILFFWLIFVCFSEIDPKINFVRAAVYAACTCAAMFLFTFRSCLTAGCPNLRFRDVLSIAAAATAMFVVYWLVALWPKVRRRTKS